MTFRFVKGTATHTRNTWPVRVKVQVLSKVENGLTAADAINIVADELGIDISNTPSYQSKAGTHIGRFRKEIADLLQKGNTEAIEACREFGIEIEEQA
jgi:hypothetical protein